jgi:hypothetical protein
MPPSQLAGYVDLLVQTARRANGSLRPLELGRGAKPLIRMKGNQTFIDPPEPGSAQAGSNRAAERKTIPFSFDKSYWSAGERTDPDYCSQQTLYDDLGKELLDHGFSGFNACILTCECDVSGLGRTPANKGIRRWTNWYVSFEYVLQ